MTTQSLSVHGRFERGLTVQALDGLNMKTVEAVDLKGNPFVNITFTAPKPIDDPWTFAASLKGNEWSYGSLQTPWTTTITGATTVRDVLVTSSEGLKLLMQMHKTVQAMGGTGQLKHIVAYDLQNFALRDLKNRLWSVDEARLFTTDETARIKKMYDDIYAGNNNPKAAAMYQEMWRKTLADAATQQEAVGYDLTNLTSVDGSLDLASLKTAAQKTRATLTPQNITEGSKDCFLFVCAAYQVGQIGNTPYSYGGLQASQGGFSQTRGYYFTGQAYDGPGSGFNTIACGVLNVYRYDKPLGCAPSAFIGLVGRKFNNGATIDGMKKATHSFRQLQQRMLRPSSGANNRPAIASYMGTCFFSGGGLTMAPGFISGGDRYLMDAKATSPANKQLRMFGNWSRVADNVATAQFKANILMQEVGRDNNPVVAEYFLGDRFTVGSEGHFAPVAQYAVKMGVAGTFVDIKTPDHQSTGRWYSLSGGWGTERGVFYID